MKTPFNQQPQYRFNLCKILILTIIITLTGIYSISVNGAYLIVNPTSITLGSASGSTETFGIASDLSWSVYIYSGSSWLSVSKTSGSGVSDITVTATSANAGTSNRTGQINISAYGVATRYVYVTQTAGYLTLNVSPLVQYLNAFLPASGTFYITSNTSWSITDNASWLSVSPVSGTNNGTITVTATSENPGTSSRSATVTIAGINAITKTVTVYQWGQGVGCVNETFTAATGTVTDNSGASYYGSGWSCEKLIQPPGASSITLTFTEFETESGMDLVRVYDGATEFSPLMGTFSGSSLPPVLTSSGGSMLIRFTTDIDNVTNGWSANYTSGGTGACINETFTAATGTVTDNSGSSNYGNNMTCSKLIQPTGGGTIALTFTSFATEAGYDIVRVYDGATTSSPLMGTYSGSSLPPVLTSTGGSMLITFTTDGSVTAAGWSATYAPGTTGGCINETFTAATGTVTDNSGSSNYGNNMTCSKLIQPTGGGTIALTFTSFATESGYDLVRVYDGATTSSTLMGTFSGSFSCLRF